MIKQLRISGLFVRHNHGLSLIIVARYAGLSPAIKSPVLGGFFCGANLNPEGKDKRASS